MPGYRVLGVLGTGGFGVVWDAVREADAHPVVIKTVHRDHVSACQRLMREAAALRRVGPPHVPELYARGALTDGTPFLVCQRLEISSLRRHLGTPLSVRAFAELALPLLDALTVVHDKGLVHRDLKPDNIFVGGKPPRVTLIDFGLTKKVLRVHGPHESHPSTTAGMILGTPLYMSPEQCESRDQIDERADIYAVGVLFYEMLTGAPPFSGDPAAVRMAHIGQRPSPVSRHVRVPRPLDELVAACLAKAAERRPTSARALSERLRAIVGGPSVEPLAAERTVPAAARARVRVTPSEHTVALLFFDSRRGAAGVQKTVTGLGGQLASIQGSRCVVAFGAEARDNPIELALDAAERLLELGVAERVVVDRARARVHASPDGTRRVMSRALYRKDRFAGAGDPDGVLMTLAFAAAAVGIETEQVAGRPEWCVLRGRGRSASAVAEAPPIGRESLVRALLGSARSAFSQVAPTIATVLGETGYGKSALGNHLTRELAQRQPGVIVVDVRAPRMGHRGASRSLLELIGTVLDHALGDTPGSGRRTAALSPDVAQTAITRLCGAALGGELWPILAPLLAALAPDVTAGRRPTGAPPMVRTAGARAVGELLCHLARRGPVACFIDDAHLVDETALDAIEYATAAATEVPIWACVMAEPSFQQARPHWGAKAAHARTHRLRKLDMHAAGELCRRLLRPAENIPQRIIARFVVETHGNPLLLTELANGLHRQELIRKHKRGESWYLAVDELEVLPELPRVEWLVERELDALPEELVAHAGLMAVLAPDISEIEIEGVLRELEHGGLGASFPLDAWVSTRRLVERGMLVRHRDRRLGFRHEILRERVARTVPRHLARGVHEAAFRYYRDTDAVDEERRLHTLARHAAECGDVASASALYLHLAEWARERHDSLGAKALYTRALEIMPEDDRRRRLRAHTGRGILHSRVSRFADALEDLRRARTLAEELGDAIARAEILLDEATVLDWTQDYHASRALVQRAVALDAGHSHPLLSARLALGLGRAHLRARNVDAAETMLSRAVAEAEVLGDAGYQTLTGALILLGGLQVAANAYPEAADTFARVVEQCESRGDQLHLALALDQRRALGLWRDAFERAVADGRRAQRIGRELGQIAIEYATSYHLAELFGFAGDLEAAMQEVARAIEIEPTCAKVPRARLLSAQLHLLAGDFHRARMQVGEIRSMSEATQKSGDPDRLFDQLSQALYASLALASQRAGVAAWRKLLTADGVAHDGIARVQVLELMALTRARVGDHKRARELLLQAREACLGLGHLMLRRLDQHLDQLSKRR